MKTSLLKLLLVAGCAAIAPVSAALADTTVSTAQNVNSDTFFDGIVTINAAVAINSTGLTIPATGTPPVLTVANDIVLANSGQITFNPQDAANTVGSIFNFTGNISGSVGTLLLNTGAGTGTGNNSVTRLSGNNTFTTTSQITVNRGIIELASDTALGNVNNSLVITTGVHFV